MAPREGKGGEVGSGRGMGGVSREEGEVGEGNNRLALHHCQHSLLFPLLCQVLFYQEELAGTGEGDRFLEVVAFSWRNTFVDLSVFVDCLTL